MKSEWFPKQCSGCKEKIALNKAPPLPLPLLHPEVSPSCFEEKKTTSGSHGYIFRVNLQTTDAFKQKILSPGLTERPLFHEIYPNTDSEAVGANEWWQSDGTVSRFYISCSIFLCVYRAALNMRVRWGSQGNQQKGLFCFYILHLLNDAISGCNIGMSTFWTMNK